MKRTLFLIVSVAMLAVSGMEIKAQDWPQYLGPNRNHTSPQKGLLRSWPESGPEVLWSTDVIKGFGGPVVKAGKVYLLDRNDETGDIMRCFDLQTGKELWKYAYDSPGEVQYPGSRSVPIVDDRHVYSVGPNGDLYCIDLQTHQPVWNKNIWTDFGGEKIPIWAISQCPVIYEDMLIISSQAPKAGVVAYNKNTGEIIWQTPNLGNETYASPVVLNIHGQYQIVMVNSSTNTFMYKDIPVTKGKVVGLEPRTGKVLWQYSDWECAISIPNPISVGDNKILIVGGYDRGATMIQVNKAADGTFSTTELFTNLDFGDQTKPPLFLDGHFYALYRTNQKREGMMCMDMNGKVLWKTGRNPDFDRGSMILADGLLLAFDGITTLYLLEPNPTAFKAISKVKMFDAAATNWSPMALADGKLLLRDQNKMICLKVVQ
ncbi:MAG: PQQ-binding-like beta-propeller repeat protein [Tannerella sp.]|jgi:outer membrane protein assembly factor BamB|nr:PQQ-binding-like beta-propeller repeat protein [Tannerella sp.]